MTGTREPRSIVLDDAYPLPPPVYEPTYDIEVYSKYMDRWLDTHVIPARDFMGSAKLAHVLTVGHRVLLLKESLFGTVTRIWQPHIRNRDWGRIYFVCDHDGNERTWWTDRDLCGANGRQLLLPVVRLREYLDYLSERAKQCATEDKTRRDVYSAMARVFREQPDGPDAADS